MKVPASELHGRAVWISIKSRVNFQAPLLLPAPHPPPLIAGSCPLWPQLLNHKAAERQTTLSCPRLKPLSTREKDRAEAEVACLQVDVALSAGLTVVISYVVVVFFILTVTQPWTCLGSFLSRGSSPEGQHFQIPSTHKAHFRGRQVSLMWLEGPRGRERDASLEMSSVSTARAVPRDSGPSEYVSAFPQQGPGSAQG